MATLRAVSMTFCISAREESSRRTWISISFSRSFSMAQRASSSVLWMMGVRDWRKRTKATNQGKESIKVAVNKIKGGTGVVFVARKNFGSLILLLI